MKGKLHLNPQVIRAGSRGAATAGSRAEQQARAAAEAAAAAAPPKDLSALPIPKCYN